MNRRQAKRVLCARYAAGPLAPWRSFHYLRNYTRMLANKGLWRGHPVEVGTIENFRFITSPEV